MRIQSCETANFRPRITNNNAAIERLEKLAWPQKIEEILAVIDNLKSENFYWCTFDPVPRNLGLTEQTRNVAHSINAVLTWAAKIIN
jgi:hypothetical protein